MKFSLVLAAIFFVLSLVPASAVYDPPGPPAVEVRAYLVGFIPMEDMDDGVDGKTEIKIDYTVMPQPGISSQEGKIGEIYFSFDYDSIRGEGVFYKGGKKTGYLVYKTRECWPVSQFNLEFDVEEVDVPGINENDDVGTASININKPGTYSILVPGKIQFKIKVVAVPVKEDSEKCSYFFEQPDTKSSSIVTKEGGYIYDWQLASMMKMWVKEYANMLFIFQQCFGGGMADDLIEKLDGDVAVISAAKHDEPSWGYKGKTEPFTKEITSELKKDGNAKQVAKDVEKNDKIGPYSSSSYDEKVRKESEHPQYVSNKRGDSIKLGKKADGSSVRSRHAIIFSGNTEPRHWKDVKAVYDTLKSKGFTDEDIVVLADSGKTAAHPYVDGPGTKKALWDTIKTLSQKMNKDEQLVFYVTNHGNLENKDDAVNKVKKDPVKEPVPPRKAIINESGKWFLDQWFLEIIRGVENNTPYISIIVEPPEEIMYDEMRAEEFLSYVLLYLNGEMLEHDLIEPIYAYDDNPDLDGYEIRFPVYDEGLLTDLNLIEIEYTSPELFQPFRIGMLMISTGGIPGFVVDEGAAGVAAGVNESLTAMIEVPEDMNLVLDSEGKYAFTERGNLSEQALYELLSESDLFGLMVEKKDWYNNNTHLVPGFIRSIAGNARINLEVGMSDGSSLDVYMVTENAYITEFEKGRLNDATIRAKTSEEVVRRIIQSDDPIKETENALKAGEITYSGVGFVNQVKLEVAKVVFRIYFFISDLVG